MKKERVFVFIDGFNLYHSLCRFHHQRYKWCDMRKLAEQFINTEYQKIQEVFFFTAYFPENKNQEKRHKLYTKALRHHGVSCVFGKYRSVSRKFISKYHKIRQYIPEWMKIFTPEKIEFTTYEEKETDVNMAVRIIEYAFLDKYDHAFIISGDSDLVGAIKTVKKNFPEKVFTSILPYKSKGKIIQKICNHQKQITETQLKNSLLPVHIRAGTEVIEIPKCYIS